MTDNLEELERLLAKATPGPWEHDSGPALNGTYHVVNDADENMICECYDGESYDEHNAALIVALRNAAPSLITTAREVEGLRAEVASGVSLVVELIGLVRLLNNGPNAISETSFPVIERARQWGLRAERKDDE